MATQPVEKESRSPRVLTWYSAGALAAVAVGMMAALMHLAGYSPVGILPMGVGIALGSILVVLAAATGVTCPKRLLVGATLLAIIAVLAEHAWLYRDFRRQWHEARAKSPHVAMFRPETPWSPVVYFRHEGAPQQMMLWCVDAALIAAATAGTVAVGQRLLK